MPGERLKSPDRYCLSASFAPRRCGRSSVMGLLPVALFYNHKLGCERSPIVKVNAAPSASSVPAPGNVVIQRLRKWVMTGTVAAVGLDQFGRAFADTGRKAGKVLPLLRGLYEIYYSRFCCCCWLCVRRGFAERYTRKHITAKRKLV